MAALRKYLFDVDFDAPDGEMERAADLAAAAEAEPPPSPPPTFTEEELLAAREEGRREGREQALQEAQNSFEQRLTQAMEQAASALGLGAEIWREALEIRHREAVAVAVAVLRKLQPELARRHSLDEIAGVLRECVAQLDGSTRVTLRVHPEVLSAVEEKARAAATEARFEGKLVLASDARLNPTDCRVEWDDGGGERDQARMWSEIDAALARAFGEDGVQASFAPE